MKAYSLDLRTRVVEAVDKQSGTHKALAPRFGGGGTVSKKLLRQRRETGSLAPKPPGGGHGPKLAEAPRAVVRGSMLKTQTEATLEEGQAYGASQGGELSQATVRRGLQSVALPRKKKREWPASALRPNGRRSGRRWSRSRANGCSLSTKPAPIPL